MMKLKQRSTLVLMMTIMLMLSVVSATTLSLQAATPEATVAAPPPPTVPAPILSTGEGCAPGASKVTWFVGLGGGTDAPVIPKEQAWVDKYNKSQSFACVIFQEVHNPQARDVLKAMMAAGNPPDIVGPTGKIGRELYRGQWADITPLAKAINFDTSKYDPVLLDFVKDEG